MPATTDVAIIGGGAIGCSIAYYLSKLGIRSTVFEKDRFASGASGATAGIIGPLWYVERSPEAYFDLGMRSLALFPELASELREAGIDPEFLPSGVLKVARTEEHLRELQEGFAWQGELGMGVTWLGPDEVYAREPELAPDVLGGVYSPREGSVRGQRFVDSLAHAAARLGATLSEGVEVTGLVTDGRKVEGVRTSQDVYYAEHTVLAAGPWTGIVDRWVPDAIPVRPVKGQRILLRTPGFLPASTVGALPGSFVPQVDGNLIVAATREEGIFDQRITADGVRQMLESAVETFPILEDATFVEARSGVRPGSPDGVPIIGPVPGWEGLSVASGHDHAGIMLSPGTGELVAKYISTGDATALDPFSPARFSSNA